MVDHAFQYEPGRAPAPETVGRFLVVERVHGGASAQASVYRGRDPDTGADVAIKVLGNPFESYARSLLDALVGDQDIEDLRREAEVLRALRHPNIVAVLEAGEDPRHGPYVVTEWAPGGDLRDRLDQAEGGRLAIEGAERIARDVLAGLEAAHEAGIVHLDIKPANILLDLDGRAKLVDFGISSDAMARSVGGRGTLGYMAPEQEDPTAGDVSPATDLYAVGVVLFEMLTGGRPEGDSDPCRLRPETPEPTARCVTTALSEDPAARHPSARAMARALASAD